jgi:hypothetical protein
MNDDIEPLEAALWFRRIEIIAEGELPSVENALRHAAHLLQLTPRPFRRLVRLSLEEDAFETLLERGEYDTAARSLVAQPAALVVDQDGDGAVRATISCAILDRVLHGTGDTAASAILAAWTTYLLALCDEFGTDLPSLPDRPLRADQFVPRRPSSQPATSTSSKGGRLPPPQR